jgi:hypothetical protein
MAWLGAVMGMMGSSIEGTAYLREGEAKQQAYNFTANVNEADAVAVREKAAFDMGTAREKAKKLMATQRALYAKAGVDLSEGSPLMVLSESAGESEREVRAIHYTGEVEATRHLNQAKLNRFYGEQAYRSGKMRGMATYLSGMGSGASKLSASYGGGG